MEIEITYSGVLSTFSLLLALGAIVYKSGSLKSTIQSLTSDNENLKSRLATVEGIQNKKVTELDNLNQKAEGMQNKIDSLDTRQRNVDVAIGKVQTILSKMTEEIGDIKKLLLNSNESR